MLLYVYCTTVLLYCSCITALLYYCITVLLYYCLTVLLYHCLTVLLSYCTTVSLSFCTTVSLSYCTTALLYYCLTVLLYHCLTVCFLSLNTHTIIYIIQYYKYTLALHHYSIIMTSFQYSPKCAMSHLKGRGKRPGICCQRMHHIYLRILQRSYITPPRIIILYTVNWITQS